MTKQRQRHERIKELWTRLVDVASKNKGIINPKDWRTIISQFKLDVGISDTTISDYIRTLRGLGLISDNWEYVLSHGWDTIEEFERIFHYTINTNYEIPVHLKT